MLRIAISLCLSLFAVSSATAQVAGTFSLLKIDASPRIGALGGAYGASSGNDVHSLYYNPSGLEASMTGMLGLSYLNHVGDLNAGFTTYVRDVDRIGTLGVGLRFLTWGSSDRIDEMGVEDGTFGASEVILTVGGARQYNEAVRIGVAVHAMTSGIDDHRASAVAIDLGTTYTVPGSTLSASLSLHNLGVVASSIGELDDELPLDLRLSISGRLQHLPLLLTVSGRNLHDPGNGPDNLEGFDAVMRHLAFGGEFQFSESFQLRFGYNHQRHQDLKMSSRLDLAGLGLGFGLRVNRFMLDYGFNSWSTLGGLHHIGVSTRV